MDDDSIRTVKTTIELDAYRVSSYSYSPVSNRGRFAGYYWSAQVGGAEIRASSPTKMREKLVPAVRAAVADAWTAPFVWVDLGGLVWTVYLAGPGTVGISRAEAAHAGPRGASDGLLEVDRRRDWDETPWMYLAYHAPTNMARLFESLGRLARGETDGVCTRCLDFHRTVVRDETGAFECPSPACREWNPGAADQNAEQAVVTAARRRFLRVTRHVGKTLVWDGYGSDASTVVRTVGDQVWVRGGDGTYQLATVWDSVAVLDRVAS